MSDIGEHLPAEALAKAEQPVDPMAELSSADAEIDEAIADMQWAHDIHESWADDLEEDPSIGEEVLPQAEAAGDADWHRDWVRRYDRVLAILTTLRQTHQT